MPENERKSKIKTFAYDFYTDTTNKTLKEWAEKYNVYFNTIWRWLQTEDTIKIKNEILSIRRDTALSRLNNNMESAINELRKIVNKDELDDVKRKACNDVIGLVGIKNTNIETKVETNINFDNIDNILKEYLESVRSDEK